MSLSSLKTKLAVLAVVLIAWAPWIVPAAYSAVWQWSTSASSNASADPSINWREGQPPSSVNDSARAMMAALAGYRDDNSGLLIATGNGSGTAYTITTNQGLAATPNDGQMLSFRPTIANGTSPTLAADAGTAFPIITGTGPSVPVPAATLLPGVPYAVTYSTTNSAWILRDFYGSSLTVPLGGLIAYTGTNVPNSNFVFPAGQCLSTTTYATYWVMLGSPASGSCSGGQFRIVDLSGRVPAGLDTMPGFSAANRLTASATGCGTAMTSIGAACANGIEGFATTLAQLPSITSSASQTITVATSGGINLAGTTGNITADSYTNGPANNLPKGGVWNNIQSLSGLNSIAVTSTGTSGTAHPSVQPTVGVTYLLRVL